MSKLFAEMLAGLGWFCFTLAVGGLMILAFILLGMALYAAGGY